MAVVPQLRIKHRCSVLDNRSWCEEDEWLHVQQSFEQGDFTIMNEHTEEMIALLEANGLPAESWVYGSYSRPLHGSWFRVEDATIIHHEHCQQPYSYAVVTARMARADVDGNELTLVSRPARNVIAQ